MGDGGVSAAFPYLNHKMPEHIKPVFVDSPKALTFLELYSPRVPKLQVINAQQSLEKSFGRTRDNISFAIYEYRKKNLMIVTCRDVNKVNTYRTICLISTNYILKLIVKHVDRKKC